MTCVSYFILYNEVTPGRPDEMYFLPKEFIIKSGSLFLERIYRFVKSTSAEIYYSHKKIDILNENISNQIKNYLAEVNVFEIKKYDLIKSNFLLG